MPNAAMPLPITELLTRLARLGELDDILPDEDGPLGRTTVEFFANSWKNARDGILSKTRRLRVEPARPSEAPCVFRFEVDTKYKRKRDREAAVELVDGTLRGTIRYRADLFLAEPDEPSIGVFVDPELGLFHPNYSRAFGVLCLGHLPSGPYELEDLLQHLYWILTYQNRSSSDPADAEAARYFATDPDAASGLEDVPPLY